MDTLPLAHNPTPASGPRNLTLPLAAWLRKMGFLVTEKGGAAPTALEAAWRGPDGLLYQVSYAYAAAAGGIFQLLACFDSAYVDPQGLVQKAEINRLREARFLLLSNVFYAEARRATLSAGTLLPAHLQPLA